MGNINQFAYPKNFFQPPEGDEPEELTIDDTVTQWIQKVKNDLQDEANKVAKQNIFLDKQKYIAERWETVASDLLYDLLEAGEKIDKCYSMLAGLRNLTEGYTK